MVHHFKLCMQNYAPLCTIPQLLVHGEPFGSLVQNNAIGFFLMRCVGYSEWVREGMAWVWGTWRMMMWQGPRARVVGVRGGFLGWVVGWQCLLSVSMWIRCLSLVLVCHRNREVWGLFLGYRSGWMLRISWGMVSGPECLFWCPGLLARILCLTLSLGCFCIGCILGTPRGRWWAGWRPAHWKSKFTTDSKA